MFETQNVGQWLPHWMERWKPFLLSLLITPFIVLLGMIDFGPEGPHLWLGYFIFPFAALFWFLGMLLQIEPISIFGLVCILLQIPVYGLIISLVGHNGRAFIIVAVCHVVAIAAVFLLFLAVLLTLKLGYSGQPSS